MYYLYVCVYVCALYASVSLLACVYVSWCIYMYIINIIWLGTRRQLAKLDLSTIAADFPQFVFSSVVRDLGVTLDQELTFAPHINRLCRDSYLAAKELAYTDMPLIGY